MSRIVKIRSNSDGLLDHYADWVLENVKTILLWVLCSLFMGYWFASPTLAALAGGGGLETPVSVAGGGGSQFTAPLIVVGLLAIFCFLIGSVLLVSCLLLHFGWWKPSSLK